jgi:septal ring factor EnvC (AmiA/AmiB activator)
MRRLPWTAAGVALLLAALSLPAAQSVRKPSEAELKAAELKELNAQLERQKRQVSKDPVEEERRAKALRDAETLVTRANRDLSSLRSRRAERAAARAQLVEERSRRQAEKVATETDLANQLRAAYFMGRNEPLKLLLNQRSPAEFGRNLTYYGYLGRLRADQIRLISENLVKIDELTAKIDEEDTKLAANMEQQKQRIDEREAARKQRELALATFKREADSRADELRRMEAASRKLEDLIRELNRRAQAAVPYDPDSPFAKRKGKLSWPVSGRIASGGRAAGQGVDIDAPRGGDVRAVHEGKVEVADYMNGMGNFILLNHGDGYFSVYGYLDELYKAEKARVEAGEKIGTVGDTGGRARPQLHFEIRSNGKSVDLKGWFRTNSPPAD